jgi:NtrC-family two-component system response regulator AlgB
MEEMSEAPRLRVLVVDDDRNIRTTLAVCLEGAGCAVGQAGTPDAAAEAVEREAFDLAFVDLRLRDASGLDLIPRLLAARGGGCTCPRPGARPAPS